MLRSAPWPVAVAAGGTSQSAFLATRGPISSGSAFFIHVVALLICRPDSAVAAAVATAAAVAVTASALEAHTFMLVAIRLLLSLLIALPAYAAGFVKSEDRQEIRQTLAT